MQNRLGICFTVKVGNYNAVFDAGLKRPKFPGKGGVVIGLDKVEEYLISMGLSYEEHQEGMWMIDDMARGLPGVTVAHTDSVVLISARIMPVPAANREAFFKELLSLNNKSLLHGAYGLDGDEVVLMDTLNYSGLDKSELEASLEAIGYAITEHFPLLSKYRKNGEV